MQIVLRASTDRPGQRRRLTSLLEAQRDAKRLLPSTAIPPAAPEVCLSLAAAPQIPRC
jgi:hypothetical protein